MAKRTKSGNTMSVKLEPADLAKFKDKLIALDGQVAVVGRKALNAGSKPILTAARASIPVRTRKLKDSITNVVRTYGTTKKGKTVVSVIGPSKVPYAHLVEFGTKAHWQNFAPMPGGMVLQHWRHPGSKAKAFLHPAFTANKDQAMNIIAKALEEGIKAL